MISVRALNVDTRDPELIGTVENVTAAVLNYNGRNLLEVILPSLARQTLQTLEVVVVDNGSTDDSVKWLRSNWPSVEVISLLKNVGVTAALNVCLQAGSSEYVALLNNDMELDPDCLGELARALTEHPDAGVAAAKLIDFYSREIIDGAGDVYEWSGEANRRGQSLRDTGQYDEPQAVFGACGGAALYRRSALQTVGGFDEQLFAIYEDVDWSFRAQLLGYSCRYVPSAVAYHMGSATLGRGLSDFALYQNWRNGIWVLVKNYPFAALLRYSHRFLFSQAHNLVWSIQTGRVRIFLRVWRDALRGMPAVLRKRYRVQRSRTVGLRELERVIGGDA
jgi:GT2 family glycosyltransferase